MHESNRQDQSVQTTTSPEPDTTFPADRPEPESSTAWKPPRRKPPRHRWRWWAPAAIALAAAALIGGLAWLTWWIGESGEEHATEMPLRIDSADVVDRLRQGTLAPSRADARRRSEVREAALRFYDRRDHVPAWLLPDGTPKNGVDVLLQVLRQAGNEGLRPSDYPIREIGVLLRQTRLVKSEQGGEPERAEPSARDDLLDLEISATSALLEYALDLGRGRVDPRQVDPYWQVEPPDLDPAAALQEALGGRGTETVLAELAPPHPQYAALRRELARLRDTAGGRVTAQVPHGPNAEPGDAAEPIRLASMAARLAGHGYLPGEAAAAEPPAVLDEALAEALRRFQRHRGLAPDGILGAETTAELNRPLSELARTIVLNMERWRWVPREMGDLHLEVNVAGFRLRLYEGGRQVMSMPVVVGKTGWRTPFFNDHLERIVLNPYWNVPKSIALDDILPKVREDPSYLWRNRFAVLPAGDGPDTTPLDPRSVDWSGVGTDPFPYRFRQLPGNSNSLGRIKFLFPNEFNVYLHDTPAKHLFERTDRALSHGCIRVENPVDLAAYLLRDDPAWTRTQLLLSITSRRPEWQSVELQDHVPVYILYWTAFVDEAGSLRFEQDLYGVDAALAEALAQVWHDRDGRHPGDAGDPIADEPRRIASTR